MKEILKWFADNWGIIPMLLVVVPLALKGVVWSYKKMFGDEYEEVRKQREELGIVKPTPGT